MGTHHPLLRHRRVHLALHQADHQVNMVRPLLEVLQGVMLLQVLALTPHPEDPHQVQAHILLPEVLHHLLDQTILVNRHNRTTIRGRISIHLMVMDHHHLKSITDQWAGLQQCPPIRTRPTDLFTKTRITRVNSETSNTLNVTERKRLFA